MDAAEREAYNAAERNERKQHTKEKVLFVRCYISQCHFVFDPPKEGVLICELLMDLQKRREELERLEKERQAEIRSYTRLMVQEKMTSNKDIAAKGKSLAELEEDFM